MNSLLRNILYNRILAFKNNSFMMCLFLSACSWSVMAFSPTPSTDTNKWEIEKQDNHDCGKFNVMLGSIEGEFCEHATIELNVIAEHMGEHPIFQWTKDSQAIPNANESTYNLSASLDGNYGNIAVVVRPDVGCNSQESITKTVDFSGVKVTKNIEPKIWFVDVPKDSICPRSSFIFSVESENAGEHPTYAWNINGVEQSASSTNKFMRTYFTKNDVVGVKVIATGVHCVNYDKDSSMVTQPILVRDTIYPNTYLKGDTSICKNTAVEFEFVSENALPKFYQWQLDEQNIKGVHSSKWQHTFDSKTGEATIRVKAAYENACITIDTIYTSLNVHVNNWIQPSVKLDTITENTFCVGTSIELRATKIANIGKHPTCEWYINEELQENETGLSASFTLPIGKQTIKLLVKPDHACIDPKVATDSVEINVMPPVEPEAEIVGLSNPICATDTLKLTAQAKNGGEDPIFQWKFKNQIVANTKELTFPATHLQSGDVLSLLIQTNAMCQTKDTAFAITEPIEILNPVQPVATIEGVNEDAVCPYDLHLSAKLNSPLQANTFQWFVNGTEIIGETYAQFTPSDPKNGDTVSVHVIPQEACVHPKIAMQSVVLKVKEIQPIDNVLFEPSDTIYINASANAIVSGELQGLWSSSNTEIASVDPHTGKVIGLKEGSAFINFSVEDFCNSVKGKIVVADTTKIKDSSEGNETDNNGGNETDNNGTGNNEGSETDNNEGGGIDTGNNTKNNGSIWETHPANTDKNDSTFLIPNFLLANGNNTFIIQNLATYPGSSFQVYNRWGILVYQSADYKNDWKGTHNGEILPTATYYFILNRKKNDQLHLFKGFIHLSH